MKAYGKRKAACIKKQIMIASAVTASCVALLVLYQARIRTRGQVTGLLKKINIIPHGEKSGDAADTEYRDTVYEEGTGDSYEI